MSFVSGVFFASTKC